MKNAVHWFEIPVNDFDRAQAFYEAITETKLMVVEAMEMKSGFFEFDMQEGAIGGSIIKGQGYEPTQKGSLVYLNGGQDLSEILNRVEAAGGKIALPKTGIGNNGFMAHFIDTEGNKVGLHSKN